MYAVVVVVWEADGAELESRGSSEREREKRTKHTPEDALKYMIIMLLVEGIAVVLHRFVLLCLHMVVDKEPTENHFSPLSPSLSLSVLSLLFFVVFIHFIFIHSLFRHAG